MDLVFEDQFSDEESDGSSSVSEYEQELNELLDTFTPAAVDEQLDSDISNMVSGYGSHGCKQRLQADLHKIFNPSPHKRYDEAKIPDPSNNPRVTYPTGGQRMVDPESADLVNSIPFHLQQTVNFPAETAVNPAYVRALNGVLELLQEEGRVLLDFYCKKYGPEAVWRSGIRSMLLSRTDELFRHEDDSVLGLDSKQMSLLNEVFEEFPNLPNLVERRVLRAALGLQQGIIEEYWEIRTKKTFPYMVMQMVAKAREDQQTHEKEPAKTKSTHSTDGHSRTASPED